MTISNLGIVNYYMAIPINIEDFYLSLFDGNSIFVSSNSVFVFVTFRSKVVFNVFFAIIQ